MKRIFILGLVVACGNSSGPSVGGDGGGGGATGQIFPSDFYYYKDVSGSAKAAESDAILAQLGQFGNGGRFDITFDFHVFTATNSTPTASITLDYDDESDHLPLPVVPGGALEGESNYKCAGGGDCHYIVVQTDSKRLFEVYAGEEMAPGMWHGGDLSIWNLTRSYDPNKNRGVKCTSADAAGLPILPGLIRVKEIVTDKVMNHALRFILPNSSMQKGVLVPPATHIGGPSSTSTNAPPYGIRLRLKSSFDENTVASAGGKVVVRALKKYGMILADGGNIALTGENDQFTQEKYGSTLGAQDLRAIKVPDFEVVEYGPVKQYSSLPGCVIDNPL